MAKIFPQWAPRVKQHKIRQLYQLDSLGIQDDDLVMEVGYALRARCISFIEANQATSGEAPCPSCGQRIPHNCDKNEVLQCGSCGWTLSWGDYFTTIQHKQLSGAEPVLELFNQFVEQFPKALSNPGKMLLIDQLLHEFHYNLKYGYTRPVAVNLVQGKLAEVIRFLDQLSYGPGSTTGLTGNRESWAENSKNARQWAFKGKA